MIRLPNIEEMASAAPQRPLDSDSVQLGGPAFETSGYLEAADGVDTSDPGSPVEGGIPGGNLLEMPEVPRFQPAFRRGYDPAEVDRTISALQEHTFATARSAADAMRDREAAHRHIAHLDGTIRALREERAALQDEVQRLHGALQQTRAFGQNAPVSAEQVDAVLIQETLLDAKRFAKEMIHGAERQAEELKAAARQEASEERARAHAEAQGLRMQAREESNQLLAAAKEEERRIREAARRARETFTQQMAEMERRLLQAAEVFAAGGQGAEKAVAMVRGLAELRDGEAGGRPGSGGSGMVPRGDESGRNRGGDGLGGIQAHAGRDSGGGGAGMNGGRENVRVEMAGGPPDGEGNAPGDPPGIYIGNRVDNGQPVKADPSVFLDGKGMVLSIMEDGGL